MKNNLEYQVAEFASKWKRESLARTIRSGKETSQIIAEDIKKGIPKQVAIKDQASTIAMDKEAAIRDRNSLNSVMNKSKNKGTFTELGKRKKRVKTSADTTRVKNAARNLKTDRFFREKLPKNAPKTYKEANQIIDRSVDDFNKAVQAPSNTVKSPITSPSPKPSLPSSKPNLLNRAGAIAAKHPGKLALGISGVGIGAALGYGAYSKMRADKGKKRGAYRK